MSDPEKRGFKWMLPINLIIIGIIGVFIPILPALFLILLGIIIMFPNIFDTLKRMVLDSSENHDESI